MIKLYDCVRSSTALSPGHRLSFRHCLLPLPSNKLYRKQQLVRGLSAATMNNLSGGSPLLVTTIVPVDPSKIADSNLICNSVSSVGDWSLGLLSDSPDVEVLRRAAKDLRETDVPVAFPTETVYGLAADVTRSSAVLGIFRAKQRPSDNPLIVHISSLEQLRDLLGGNGGELPPAHENIQRDSLKTPSPSMPPVQQHDTDLIPVIYQPLIEKFWPGPLTLIMPNPDASILAPEVTAGLQTFGVRMPRNVVALALIKLAGVPLAAPSANASSKPSPTTAAHVKHDLDGRISTIIDGGQCDVGVESTVVDGLTEPPQILRPGGISIDQLRSCPGWEKVKIGYQDASEAGSSKPKAPGMKYKHYSPKARVILYEAEHPQPSLCDIAMYGRSVGIIRTSAWNNIAHISVSKGSQSHVLSREKNILLDDSSMVGVPNGSSDGRLDPLTSKARKFEIKVEGFPDALEVWDIDLGSRYSLIARGLFSALRELDKECVDTILVEGIDAALGGVAAAVMNRLRKAAETTIDVP